MVQRYYFDTSIWLDFFENRDEPNFPKGEWARKLIDEIIESNAIILYSDINLVELDEAGYSHDNLKELLKKLIPILVFVEPTERETRKSKDLSSKRNIPKGDAFHALIARGNKGILVTLDKHFKKLGDIIKSKRPQDLI